jgi:hypothetical protein
MGEQIPTPLHVYPQNVWAAFQSVICPGHDSFNPEEYLSALQCGPLHFLARPKQYPIDRSPSEPEGFTGRTTTLAVAVVQKLNEPLGEAYWAIGRLVRQVWRLGLQRVQRRGLHYPARSLPQHRRGIRGMRRGAAGV